MAEPSPKSLDAFKADLEREGQVLGLLPTNYLAQVRAPQVAYRASMLPIGNYEDGSIAFPVWPQTAIDAYEALGRFHRGEAPQPQDAVLAGLVMSGSGFGALGARGARAVSGKAPAQVEAPVALPSHSAESASPTRRVETGSGPQTIRAYHGTNESFDAFDPTKTKEVGFHFGSKEAAARRSVAKNGPAPLPWPIGKGWRKIPVDIEASKIAELSHDPAGFGGYSLAKQLVEDGIAPPEVLKEATRLHVRDYHTKDLSAARDYVRQWLIDNGYDTVRYPNTYEGGGSSYMTMGTGNVKHARTGETLFANPEEAAPVGLLPALANSTEKQGIRAYHGSPYDFDRFDASKIGTGEGAQAYGHGLYFAENEGVARSYRDSLSDPRLPRNPTPEQEAGRYLFEARGDRDAALRTARNHRWQFKGQDASAFDDIIQSLEAGTEVVPAVAGKMYEVRLNAEPEAFLDWDKPLSQQSEAVRRAFPEDLHGMKASEAHDELAARLAPEIKESETGWDYVVNTINDKVQRRDRAAEAMREAGIPGIRYLDQGSRGKDEGTYNYVVFPGNENLIDIIRKYANAPEAAPVGALAMDAASRMERARAMGFDTDKVWYHGTGRDFDNFKPSDPGEALGPGVYVSDMPSVANQYADAPFDAQTLRAGIDEGMVYPLHARVPRMFEWDGTNMPQTLARAEEVMPGISKLNPAPYHVGDRPTKFVSLLKEAGYDGIYNRWNEGADVFTQANIFDPKNLRSVNAAFDPAMADSANLLAVNPPSAAPAGALAMGGEGEEAGTIAGLGWLAQAAPPPVGNYLQLALRDMNIRDLNRDGIADDAPASPDPGDPRSRDPDRFTINAREPAFGWQVPPIPFAEQKYDFETRGLPRFREPF